MIDDHPFALCLTHDVDRPYKRFHQALYYTLAERSMDHLRSFFARENPYWQFEEIMALEDDLGVRSAFYFLSEPGPFASGDPLDWVRPDTWIQQLGRYDPTDDDIAAVIRELDDGGWEVGLHGSYHSGDDIERLRQEKEQLEDVLGHSVRGGRQHYLRMNTPETWQIQAELRLEYDSTLGSSTDYGFVYDYGLVKPLSESFTVFPLTLMEQTLPDPASRPQAAWQVCADLVAEARENDAVMTVLWHPRYFNEREFPGYRRLYRRLIEHAQDVGAWIGPPAALLDHLDESTPGTTRSSLAAGTETR
ncbi:polysaccharide deacetylase family protein [Halapricum hydrolyticum]|uniref:Polysaccharide deacetylase family protein n=1 Tax=Halapricum hydrolyticum TaxID=2979991 RepID=A0AAE3IFP4_9EURY|nr:polysaccharide deacetylase family protein [Halapricum hydrolyticum]MCU4718616.1 polysaccharide deacetylase family protein [Halapricum hydrolyticum]MCU4727535.1 polysaccharide deacetylase family protein [Halapricum hydrolyticum]